MTEAADGNLLCAFYAGKNEGEPDVAIWFSIRDGKEWSDLLKIAEFDGIPCWNPVLFTLPSKEVLLFYKGGKNPREWSGFLKRSLTNGNEWSPPELLPAGIIGAVRSKPLLLENGTLLCGSSLESWKRWGSYVDITTDEGKTWVKTAPINVPNQLFGVIQPSLFHGKNGEIRMMMRSNQIGAICTATSKDQGRTWTDASPTTLPNPNAAIETLNLSDGTILLFFNDSKINRSPLSIAQSKDGGVTWERILNLEDQEGEFSYPSAIQTEDGLVHVTYTYNRQRIKHVVLDPRSW